MLQPSDLKSSPLFKDLSESELSKISSIAHEKSFSAGTLIIKQDDLSDFFYTVLKGSVRVYRTLSGPERNEIELALLREGSFFGEMAVLDGSARSVNVQAVEDSTFLLISREDFLREIWKFPTIVAKLLTGLTARLRKTDETFIHELQEKNAILENLIRELKKVDEMKSKFFALASHELRTPLGIILMSLPLLEQHAGLKLSQEGKSIFQMLEQQLVRLGDTISSILKASDAPEISFDDKKEKTQLNAVIRKAAADLNYFCSLRNLKVTAELDPRLPKILLDRSKFYQVILNLFMNAIRFTPDGGSIAIQTKKEDSTVSFSIADTGVGIEKRYLEDIFKPFYAIGNEMRHSSGTYQFMSGGLGLGLTIVKKFVEYHNGKIEVASQKNVGSTFTVNIPIDASS